MQTSSLPLLASLACALVFSSVSVAAARATIIGSIERLDPALDQILATDAVIEKLGEGYLWAEGPVWMPGGYLLFSDVKSNTVFKFSEGHGVEAFLRPSGYTGTEPPSTEPGSNGLTHDAQGRLVLAQHGDRRIARREADGRIVPLVESYQGKKFNSPNDLVYRSDGSLFFTDPPYGLTGGAQDPKKELSFQGVYRLSPQGELTLLTDQLSRPNGITLSPDERTLYVANSDRTNPVIMAYPLQADGSIGTGRVFFDEKPLLRKDVPGGPDGIKVDSNGNVFSSGPGGILILSPEGKHLGTIRTGVATANCNWGGSDGSVLYLTANHWLCRIQTKTHRAR